MLHNTFSLCNSILILLSPFWPFCVNECMVCVRILDELSFIREHCCYSADRRVHDARAGNRVENWGI